MSRGKQLKTKMKEAIKEAMIVGEAIELAKQDVYMKNKTAEKWQVTLKERLDKTLDKIDPLELVAVVGLAIPIHAFIGGSADWITKLQQLDITTLLSVFSPVLTSLQIIKAGTEGKSTLNLTGEIVAWLVSIAIAYYVIRHGIPFGSIASLVGMFA